MNTSLMSESILIEPGTRFTCVPCGFCCGYWDIEIDQARMEALNAKEWVRQKVEALPALKGQGLFRILGQGEAALLQRQSGGCSFLDERMLCSIHAIDGMEAKPAVCQQYPNIYYKTPRGIELQLDYSCPEVIKNYGDPVTAEGIRKTLPNEYVQVVGSRLPLSPKSSLDWQGYLHLEALYADVLARKVSHDRKILALHQLTQSLANGLANLAEPDGGQVKELLAPLQGSGLDPLLQQVRPSSKSRGNRDLYLAILIQLVESSFSREVYGQPFSAGQVIGRVLKQWKATGVAELKVFKLTVDYVRAKRVRFDLAGDQIREPVDRYVKHLVKSLVGTGSVPIQKRIAIMATNFALFRWFSCASAAARDQREVGLEDIVFGIKVVEKFLSNRLFNKLEKEKGLLASYVGMLFDNPTLTATMLSAD
ncbi:MAG: YkgJ family cysteine cluster protein [Acidobacteria bacterium]|nr:YkgJ family cysteine cluster protein [Acidobacteriota bacterium]MCI0719843.1 YkgJ family cysteine cluster protein [Acidobacteriota bacterium]